MVDSVESRRKVWSRYELAETEFPVDVVGIETVGNCNRSCGYCPVSQHDKRVGRLAENVVYRFFDQLADLGYKNKLVFHYYNEPMLDKRILDFLRYAASKLPDAFKLMTTNGDLTTRDNIFELFDAGATRVAISAHDEATAVRFARLKAELDPPASERLEIRPYYRVGDGTKAARITNRGGAIDLGEYSVDEVVEASPEGCNRVEFYVDFQGNAHPCCMDFSDGYVIGNIKKTPVLEIWRSARHLYEEHFTGQYTKEVCRKCVGL